ncbi:MAG: metallophosphoesterase [Methanobrevibacter sp.]|nr:metallophosphoesterase [Methanobrevibacter sp.]
MKVLQISDIHSEINPRLNSYLDENKIDLLIISGDITNFGPSEFAMNYLNELKEKNIDILTIPGNCDTPEAISAIDSSEVLSAHNKVVKYKNIIFFAFGGSNPTPFNTPFEFDEDTIYNEIKSLIEKESIDIADKSFNESTDDVKDDYFKVLLTHAPPFGSDADLIPSGAHVGSTAIEKIIKENNFDINLCGHIHEACSISKINNTIIANPGNLHESHGILFELKKNKLLNIEIVDL